MDERQAVLFAGQLGPGVVVAPASVAANGGGPITERFAGKDPAVRHTLLLLGQGEQDGLHLPEEVLYLDSQGLDSADLVRRIHLVLLGREIGLDPDGRLDTL